MQPEIAAVFAGARRWAIVHADCLDVLPSIERVDHLVTDGPYGIGDNAATSNDGPYIEALRWAASVSVTVSFFGYAESIVDWIIRLGWQKPDEWVTWYPRNAEAKAGAQCKYRLPRLTEHIAIYGTTPGVRRLRRERSKGGKSLAGRADLVARRRFSPHAALRETAQLGDVWTDASPGIGFKSPDRLHPNEKPETVMEKLVTLVSEPDDLVMDPFCGSGTTGVACLRLGRRFIGIEREEKYARLATERLLAEEQHSTLAAKRAGQAPLFAPEKST